VNQLELFFGSPLRIVVTHEAAPAVIAKLTITFENFAITVTGGVMYTLPVDKQVKMQIAYVDVKGNPALIDGSVTWQSSDTTIVVATADTSDSTIVAVTPGGSLGQAQVTASADVDLGAGVTLLLTASDVQVVAGQAVAGTITPLGAPIPFP
jgi:hypothetical protein